VFRVGHMGSQAHPQYMQAAMDRLRAVLNRMANGQ
jgi:aspartate aminotransferase-like enzyme